MPETYTYKVRDSSGKLIQGSIESDNSVLVANRLRQMGYVPISIDKAKGTGLKREISIPFITNRVKLQDVAIFSRQFATMINSGLTLLRALNVLAIQTDSPSLREILIQVRQEVESGKSLAASLAPHPKAFDRLYVAMVRAGEASGNLDQVLENLAVSVERKVDLKRQVKAAMIYPIVVLFLIIIILIAMLVFIVPQFKSMYATLHGSLPLPTRVLVATSNAMAKFAVPLLVLVGVIVWLVKRWLTTSTSGRLIWDTIKIRVWIFGPLARKIALTRMTENLASLLSSGVPVLESLEITKDTVGNVHYANAISDVQIGVKGGEPIVNRFSKYDIFPPMMSHMIGVGEETGAVDEMLRKISEFYAKEVAAMVASLTSLIEPVLIIVMGTTVGSMVISLYLPMFKVITLLNKQPQ